MSSVVFKYPLGYHGTGDIFVISVPEDFTPLHVDFDPQGELCLWARIPTPIKFEHDETVVIRGTGHALPNNMDDKLDYINTFMSPPFVFHAFMLNKEK